jgi:pimeloyl-ACP methyl ester carboxylesterase
MRDGYAELGTVRLHYVEAGEGPLVVLLHGFPEFWFGWRQQIERLAAAGFRAVAPDQRGYNLSSKPPRVSDYDLDPLAADVRDLIEERGERRAFVAGHDWGGAVAWATAMFHPEVVERLAILNAPHLRVFIEHLKDPRQLARSWYMGYFQLPFVPERLARAREWWMLRAGFERDARPGAFTATDIERYVEAWEQPGAATAMLNYYRALSRQTPGGAAKRIRPIEAPTRVIWGRRDRYLTPDVAEPHRSDVPNLERVIHLDTSHWVQHDEPGQVADLLVEFFRAPATLLQVR